MPQCTFAPYRMRELIAILRRIQISLRGSLLQRLIFSIALASLAGACAGLLPSVVGLAIDTILGRSRSSAPGLTGLLANLLVGAPLWRILAITLVATLITVGISVLSSQRGSALSGEVTAALRIEMLRAVLEASPREVDATGRAVMADKAPPPPPGVKVPETKGMEVVKLMIARESGMAADFIVSLLTGLPQALVTLLILAWELITSGMSVVFAGGLGLFFLSRLLSDRASKRVAGAMQNLQKTDVAIFANLGEMLAGTEDLRLLGARGQAISEFTQAARRTADARKAFAQMLAVSGQIKSVFSALAPLLVVLALSFSSTQMKTGDVAKLLLVVPLLLSRLESIDAFRTGFVERGQVLRAAARLLELPTYPPPPPDPLPLAALPNTNLQFKELHFAPSGSNRNVLDNISIEIPEGAVVGICGRSGCGKSTLVRMLLRLDEPTGGQITVGGADLRRIPPAELPQLFGILGQSSRLLERSIAQNLSIGLSTPPSEDAMKEALRRVRLDELTGDEPSSNRNLHTEFRAVPPSLSGGEQRRLLLARMLLRNPRFFVLDEPEAGLPSATAEQILRELRAIAAGRTCIVVTHAPHLLESNFNIVMDAGKIAAVGTHQELSENSELYRSLLAEGLKKSSTVPARPTPPMPGPPPPPNT